MKFTRTLILCALACGSWLGSFAQTSSDMTPPVAICQDVTVQLDQNGSYALSGSEIDGGSSDNQAIANLGVCMVGCKTVDWTQDDQGNPLPAGTNLTTQLAGLGIASVTANGGINQAWIFDSSNPTGGDDDLGTPNQQFGGPGVGSGGSTNNTALGNILIIQENNNGVPDDNAGGGDIVFTFTQPTFVNAISVVDIEGNGTYIQAGGVTYPVPPTGDNGVSVVPLNAGPIMSLTVHLSTSGGISGFDLCQSAPGTSCTNMLTCDNLGPANQAALIVTDAAGNNSYCVANVTVEDNIAPEALCQDITAQLDANGEVTISTADIDGGSTDNCSVTVASPTTTFDCSDLGSNHITLTATDGSGNTDNCTASITVEDNVAPNALCQDFTVYLNSSGLGFVNASDIDAGSNDACGIANVTIDAFVLACGNVGANTVTLTATDVNGNASTCTAQVTVEDTLAPTPLCQDITVSLDANGNADVTPFDLVTSVSDNCGSVTCACDSLSQTNFDCDDLGTVSVTVIATDVNGNAATCTSQVTVEDNIAPVAVCQDATVQLDSAGNGMVSASDIDGGSTDNCDIILIGDAAFTCADLGVNTVTLTVADSAGNSDNCTANVTVEDNVGPNALCQDITVYLNASGLVFVTESDIDGGSSDACGIASITTDAFVYACGNVGPNTATLTVTDVNGNVSTCTSQITVTDTLPPTPLCQDITVSLDANGNASVTPFDLVASVSDNCGSVTCACDSLSQTEFDCDDIGVVSVVVIATDVNGNSATCTSQVTVEDNIAPIAVCQDVTVQLDANGNASVSTSDIDGGSTDNCDIILIGDATFDCSDIGVNAVTLTVADSSGNSDNCTANVTVEDNIAPTAVCQNINVNLDANGQVTIAAADVDGGSSDNCSNVTLSVSQATFTCADLGNNFVTLTVTDAGGNTSTCQARVRVRDRIPPVAICQNVTVQLDTAGIGEITVADVDNGSFDNCTVNVAIDRNTFSCTDVTNTIAGDLIISEYVEAVGQERYLEIFNGTGAPVNLADYEVRRYPGGNTNANNNNRWALSGTLANGAVIVLRNDQATGPGQAVTNNTLKFSGDDAVALFNVSTSSFVDIFGVIGEDPGNAWLANTGEQTNNRTLRRVSTVLNGVTTNPVLGNGSAGFSTLGSQWNEHARGNLADLGRHGISSNPNTIVTLTATDGSNNTDSCTAVITVEDNIAPTAVCENITVTLGQDGTYTLSANEVDGGSFDNCCSPNLEACIVSCNTIDFNTCGAGVTLTPGIPLTTEFTSLGIASITAVGGINEAWLFDSGNPTGGDTDLGTPNQQFGGPGVGNGGGSNDTPLGFVVIIQENAGVPDDNANGGDLVFTFTGPTNVNEITLLDIEGNGSYIQAGSNQIAIPASGDNGVSVINVNAQGVSSLTVHLNTSGAVAAMNICPSTSNDCDTVFTCDDLGVNQVTLTVSDNSGNTDQCTAEVTVTDSIAPTAVCQSITVQLDANGNASITASDIDGGSSDNCSIDTITVSQTDFDCSDIGVVSVTLSVTDAAGNVSTCMADVTVEDNTAPTALCQNITVSLDANGNAVITASDIDGGSSDNCGIVSMTASQTSFDCSDIGIVNVTLTVTDGAGNVSTCTTDVTVEDNTAPNAVCQNITVQLDGNGNAVITASDIDGGSTDNCGIVSITASQTTFDCSDLGVVNVTLTVTDGAGNISTCVADVSVEDNMAPSAVCQNITVQLDANGNATISESDIDGGSTDNCGIVSTVVSQTSFDCSDVGVVNVTLTVTDAAGNVSTCTADVDVEDNIAPVAVCQNITVQLDQNGSYTLSASEVDGGSTDNCGVSLQACIRPCGTIGFETDDQNAPLAAGTQVTTQLAGLGIASVSATGGINQAWIFDSSNPTGGDGDLGTPNTQFGGPGTGSGGSNNDTPLGNILIIQENNSGTPDDNAGGGDLVFTFTGATDVNAVTILDNENNGSFIMAGSNQIAIPTTGDNGLVTVPVNATGLNSLTIHLSGSGAVANLDICSSNNASCDTTFTCADVGDNEVILTVTDPSGNVDSCTAIVTIDEGASVNIDCPGDITTTCETGDGGAWVSWNEPTASASSTCSPGGCPTDTHIPGFIYMGEYNGHRYYCSDDDDFTWDAANAAAMAAGGDLVTINNSGENQWLKSQIMAPYVWIGYNDVAVEGTFEWSSGENSSYTNWQAGEPNNAGGNCCGTGNLSNADYAALQRNNGRWYDRRGCLEYEFVMEIPCASAGVTVTQISGPANGGLFPQGTTTVIYVASDANGNTDTCSFDVTVEEVFEILCPGDITVPCNNNQGGATVTWNDPTVIFESCDTSACSSNTHIPGFIYMGEFEGHRYYCSNTSNFDWNQANTAAMAAGGDLVTINSYNENQWLRNKIQASYVWIGYNDVANEGQFEWSSGESSNYTRWQPGEPNNQGGNCCGIGNLNNADYAALRKSNGRWYDRKGCNTYEFVMEIPCTGYTLEQIAGPASGSHFSEGTTTITYLATATNGNTATCSFDVTVEECTPIYCHASASCSGYEWIETVIYSGVSNNSGNDGGYGDYTNITNTVVAGGTMNLSLTPGFSGQSYQEYWKVWVDWNRDGDFYDAGELVFADNGSGNVSGNVQVPSQTSSGALRMRVAMRWNCYAAGPCCGFNYGEVEDYTLYVVANNARTAGGAAGAASAGVNMDEVQQEVAAPSVDPSGFEFSMVHPNPVLRANQGTVTIDYRSGRDEIINIRVSDLYGKVFYGTTVDAKRGVNQTELNVSDLSAGTYLIEVTTEGDKKTEKLVVQ